MPNEDIPSWAHQPSQDLGPLPDPKSSKIYQPEVHPLPSAPRFLAPIVINGVLVERVVRSYRTIGRKGIQYVLQEGPLLHARFRLVPSSKLVLKRPDSTLQRVKALPRVKAEDKDPNAPKVEGIFAVAFRDPNNEGPAVLMKYPKAYVVIGVQWTDKSMSWEMKSAVTKFLKGQTVHFLYDIATRSEDKFRKYVASLRELQPPPECEGCEDLEDPSDDQVHLDEFGHLPRCKFPIVSVPHFVHVRLLLFIFCLYFPYLVQ